MYLRMQKPVFFSAYTCILKERTPLRVLSKSTSLISFIKNLSTVKKVSAASKENVAQSSLVTEKETIEFRGHDAKGGSSGSVRSSTVKLENSRDHTQADISKVYQTQHALNDGRALQSKSDEGSTRPSQQKLENFPLDADETDGQETCSLRVFVEDVHVSESQALRSFVRGERLA